MAELGSATGGGSTHTANILGALAVLIQDRVESAWQSSLDLSPMAAAALVQIDNEPGSSIEAVAGRIGLTHSATVRVIDKLAERGLVEKDRARKDARAQSLTLSKPGKRLAQQLHEARNQVTDDLLAGLVPEQRSARSCTAASNRGARPTSLAAYATIAAAARRSARSAWPSLPQS